LLSAGIILNESRWPACDSAAMRAHVKEEQRRRNRIKGSQ